MTSKDLKDLIDYVMKNNSWKECSYLFHKKKQPKYLDFKLQFTLDTRDGIIFSITFRNSGEDKSFWVENQSDLKEVYKWLDEVGSDK